MADSPMNPRRSCCGMGEDAAPAERIPRRPLTNFQELETGVIGGIFGSGWQIWRVALDDDNQYGPHAMIVLLLLMSLITGGILWIMDRAL